MRRLDQFLANLGYCSRREARLWIEEGRVTVGGKIADDFGQKAAEADVRVDGDTLDHPGGLLLMLHKPVGLVWFAWASLGGTVESRFEVFGGDRAAVRGQAVREALKGLLELASRDA